MNTNEMNNGNIFILNFTFNHKLRILQCTEQVIQLRKKEADVLALLCEKYPNPVSQKDFLMNVWGGGYVTAQSIAQVIRSLRLSLGDKKKCVISTIPKLGYKLNVPPVYEDLLPTKFQYGEVTKVQHGRDEFSYAEQQTVINAVPLSTSISIIPYTQVKKNFFTTTRIIFSCVILIFGSLVCVTLNTKDISADNVESHDKLKKIMREESPALVDRRRNITENTNKYTPHSNMVNDKNTSLQKNNDIYDCFQNNTIQQ